ncbi:MAG: hypothetical protein GY797_02005 [Deltaproteobacteria bacterium]|nr:hypothetical protein [Deltaproteobacteria bacterium]
MADTLFIIGIIGHRDLGGEDVDFYVQSCCHKILSELRVKYPKIKAISAISQGADSIFAQSAISLNIQLESVVPFDDFKSDFAGEISCERYKTLRKSSDFETKVNFSKRSNLAYKKSMEWVVIKSNIVIAVWDGKKIGSIGGTWEAILLCEKLNKTMINIDIHKKAMSLNFNECNNYFSRKNITVGHFLRYV